MKLNRRILMLTLCFCAVFAMMCVSASAEEETHSHALCAGTTCTDPTHTSENQHGSVDFAHKLTSDDSNNLYVDGSAVNVIDGYYQLTGGNYYLGADVTLSEPIKITGNVNLCLNGKTLTKSISVKGNATLNICDCSREGGGVITSTGDGSIIQVDANYDGKATVNLYRGKVSGSVKDSGYMTSSGTIYMYNNKSNDEAIATVFNMYGGEVCNDYQYSGGSAVYVSYANIGTGYYNINMYGGSVTCEKGYGFNLCGFNGSQNTSMKITGGTITSGWYGVWASSNNKLTLSGNPKFIDKKYYSGTAGIYIPDDVTLTVADDFAPADNTTISVEKNVGNSGSVVIAQPATSGGSLSDKAKYFASSKEGYFVECKDGNLQLATCAITAQPTESNAYTVTASGGSDTDKVKYQWYTATKGTVDVTDKNATPGSYSGYRAGDYWNQWYTTVEPTGIKTVSWEAFTLPMAAGDKLTVKYRSYDGASSSGSFNNFILAGNGSTVIEMPGTEGSYYKTYTFTAPADGDYTLTATATPGSYTSSDGETTYNLYCYFSATVSADVAGNALDGQTAVKLNTEGLSNGKYLCAVTWEDKTTLYSNAVNVHTHIYDQNKVEEQYLKSAATCTSKAVYYKSCECGETSTTAGTFENGDILAHTYTVQQHDETQHWNKCSSCDAIDTKVNHSGGTATCTSEAVCATCNTAYGGVKADNHTGSKTWTKTSTTHEQKWSCCNAVTVASENHEWNNGVCTECGYECSHSGGTATCIAKAKCERCEKEYGELGAHTWQSANCTTPKTCSLCLETEGAELGHDWATGFTVDTQPTCTTAGSKSKHCSRCDEVKEVTAIAALGHDWGRYTVTRAATIEEEGIETRNCQHSGCAVEQIRTIAKLTPTPVPVQKYSISGEVVDKDNDELNGASLTLVLGDRQIATATTDESGKYTFSDIEPGVYNLVASNDGATKTVKVEITKSNVAVETIKMPQGKTRSVVEVKGDENQESVEAVVGNLDEIFTDEKANAVYTNEDKTTATTGGSVEIKLIVDKKAEEKIADEITEVLKTDTRNNVGMRLDIKVEKTVTPHEGEAEVTSINDTGVLLETVIKLPTQLQGKQSYTIYRLHGDEVQALTTTPSIDGEYIEISSDRKSLTIHAKYYSEYVIAYQEKSSSSGGGHTAAYQVITPVQPKEGGILVSPKTAEYGETVTVTLKPEEGYEADTVAVLDKDGKAIEIVDKGDGTYTFKMPIGNVTVSATFKKAADKGKDYADCPKDTTCPIDKFTDAENAAWYHDGVHYCLENGLMKGMSSTEFLPNGDVTRAQIVTILWRIEGSKAVDYLMRFKDVEDGSWYAEAIRWAASEDVVTGYSDEAFGPNDSVTREQLATILYRYAKYKGMDVTGKVAELDKFSDGASVSAYALDSMKWAVGSQIINGTTVTTLSPKGTATRAQAASLMQRFLTENK